MAKKRMYFVTEYIEQQKACDKRPTVCGPQSVVDHVAPMIAAAEKELFAVLSLNTRNGILACDVTSVGTAQATLVHPREVFRRAVQLGAVSIIVAHNHPSGDVSPSGEDIEITKRLHEAGVVLGINLLDHVIVSKWKGGYEYCSMKERRLLK